MANFKIETVQASGAVAVSGNVEFPDNYGTAKTLRAQLNVSAASGTTPTLDVVLEDTLDGSTWNTIGTFTQKTAVSREVINVTTPFAERLRARWTVGGATPSFTFSIICASDPV